MNDGITTRCPSCHFTTLVINCGQLLCTWHKCPDPTMIHRQGETEIKETMESIDDGGPAFPMLIPGEDLRQRGMSLLDYFAGQALPSMITLMQKGLLKDEAMPDATMGQIVASQAYGIAADMLKERARINASP